MTGLTTRQDMKAQTPTRLRLSIKQAEAGSLPSPAHKLRPAVELLHLHVHSAALSSARAVAFHTGLHRRRQQEAHGGQRVQAHIDAMQSHDVVLVARVWQRVVLGCENQDILPHSAVRVLFRCNGRVRYLQYAVPVCVARPPLGDPCLERAIALYTMEASASVCTPEPRDILGAVVSPATAYRLTLGAGSAAMASWIVEYDSGMPPACATRLLLLPGSLT